MESKVDINSRIIKILNSKEPAQAILQLLQWQQTVQNPDVKMWIREPILFILENQHDWENILKCLKYWKGFAKFQRGFYQRMKSRVQQKPEKNISQLQIKKEIPKLIDKYISITQETKKKPLIKEIQKFLVLPNHENKQQIQKLENKQVNIYEKKQEQVLIDQNTNSIKSSSSFSSRQSIKPILKKPTLGMLSKGTEFSRPDQNIRRNQKRLSFVFDQSMKNVSKNILDLAHKHQPKQKAQKNQGSIQIKQNKSNQGNKIQISKQQNIKQKQLKVQEQIKQIKQPQKVKMIFPQNKQVRLPQRKQPPQHFKRQNKQAQHRVGNLFKTQKKQQQQMFNNPQHQIRSAPRSITPRKPLIQRRKIIINKAPQSTERLDYFQSQQKGHSYFDSSLKKPQTYRQFSQKKNRRRYFTNNQEQDQLKKQIQQENKAINNSQSLFESLDFSQKQQTKQVEFLVSERVAIGRRPDQLLSDNQLSLLNLESRQPIVTMAKIVSRLKLNTLETFGKVLLARSERY